MTAEIIPFNPLNKKNLGASVAEALLDGKTHPLGTLPEFDGAGIYVIYYSGAHPAYTEIAKRNQSGKATAPIYVGKAVPAGARKGVKKKDGEKIKRPLFKRLSEHAESIQQVASLQIGDFTCRYLVVDDIWIPLGESLLIARYSPVWNALVDGFGNHDPGKRRHEGLRPRWDTLHPGRPWASKGSARKETAADIQRDVETYLRNATFPTTTRFIESPEN